MAVEFVGGLAVGLLIPAAFAAGMALGASMVKKTLEAFPKAASKAIADVFNLLTKGKSDGQTKDGDAGSRGACAGGSGGGGYYDAQTINRLRTDAYGWGAAAARREDRNARRRAARAKQKRNHARTGTQGRAKICRSASGKSRR